MVAILCGCSLSPSKAVDTEAIDALVPAKHKAKVMFEARELATTTAHRPLRRRRAEGMFAPEGKWVGPLLLASSASLVEPSVRYATRRRWSRGRLGHGFARSVRTPDPPRVRGKGVYFSQCHAYAHFPGEVNDAVSES